MDARLVLVLGIAAALAASAACVSAPVQKVNFTAVAVSMNAAAGNITRVDLTVVDEKAVTGMRAQVKGADANLQSALAVLEETPPATTQEKAQVGASRAVIKGFQAYDQAMLGIADMLGHVLAGTERLRDNRFAESRAEIRDGIGDLEGAERSIGEARDLRTGVDEGALPQPVKVVAAAPCISLRGRGQGYQRDHPVLRPGTRFLVPAGGPRPRHPGVGLCQGTGLAEGERAVRDRQGICAGRIPVRRKGRA